MLTVYKYPLQMADRQTIAIPQGGKILCIQAQREQACLWALVDDTQRQEERIIHISGTGHPIKRHPNDLRYIGTFQMLGGDLVFHAFEGAP